MMSLAGSILMEKHDAPVLVVSPLGCRQTAGQALGSDVTPPPHGPHLAAAPGGKALQ